MPIQKFMKGTVSDVLAAEGLMYHDRAALEPCQEECFNRVGMTIQIEQEAYLNQHPEVKAMMVKLVQKMVESSKRKDTFKDVAQFFYRPAEELDNLIREYLGIPKNIPYTREDKPIFKYFDGLLDNDLRGIILKHFPPEPWKIPTPDISTPNTESSSFLSIITSQTTLPTPEPVLTPEPTLSEVFYNLVSNTVDKAVFLHVDDRALRYDTAYVEVCKCVEEAMEIPVIEVREDIAELFYNAYSLFELDIDEKERIAAEIAWEKRMRKKLKRTLRRLNNFKGYETPPTPKSEISSHESYKKPPPKPCPCHPQSRYNRYCKDRFGIYLPRSEEFSANNVTVTPNISIESIPEAVDDEKADTKSIMSKKSTSGKAKKTTTFDT